MRTRAARRPDDLFSADPEERLSAARAQGAATAKGLAKGLRRWPPNAPGSLNAWLLLVTGQEPTWRDPLLQWPDQGLTLGRPHEGFFYPDPVGFWAELRRWVVLLFRLQVPEWSAPDCLALTALLPTGGLPDRLQQAIRSLQPRVVLYLDEAAWATAPVPAEPVPHVVRGLRDPGEVHEGFWAVRSDGLVVGKSPLHPAEHESYRPDDLTAFLRSAPLPLPPGR